MVVYQYAIRDQIERVARYAEALRTKFTTDAGLDDLLRDAQNLSALYGALVEVLPKEVAKAGNAARHLAWMQSWLQKGQADKAETDILDICRIDLPTIERAFRDWCDQAAEFDEELREKTAPLLIQRQFDSAIRKAFVILTSRLRTKYGIPRSRDGAELANSIFGSEGIASNALDPAERAAMRDLVAGIYGVYRNRYGHEEMDAPLHEAEAVIGVVNWVLVWLGDNTSGRR